jgi:hypothetical protein
LYGLTHYYDQCPVSDLEWAVEILTHYQCFVSDLEWKIIYVGAAESEEYDQTLDSVLVGPVPAGKHMFVFQVSVNIVKSTESLWIHLDRHYSLKFVKCSIDSKLYM